MLQLGEHLLDWVEIGAVRRQKEEPCSHAPDRLPHDLTLVAAKIVPARTKFVAVITTSPGLRVGSRKRFT